MAGGHISASLGGRPKSATKRYVSICLGRLADWIRRAVRPARTGLAATRPIQSALALAKPDELAIAFQIITWQFKLQKSK
jgi:hypothetical protein